MNDFFEDLRAFIGCFFLIVGVLLGFEGMRYVPPPGELNLDLVVGAVFVIFAIAALIWATISFRSLRRGRPAAR